MSRGPRDLRDLICVSRLTFRQSDDEFISDEELVTKDPDTLSLDSSSSCDSRQESASQSRNTSTKISPDSGFVTNGGSPSESSCVSGRDSDLKLDLSGLQHKKKNKKKKKKKALVTDPQKIPFPKPTPLPPVGTALPPLGRSISADSTEKASSVPTKAIYIGSTVKSSNKKSGANKDRKSEKPASVDKGDDIDEESVPIPPAKSVRSSKAKFQASHVETGDFDEMMCFMDATIVSNWLTRSNASMTDVAAYVHDEDNFVQFAHFWLSDFPDLQKREIFEMEIEILREELGFAFAVGKEQGNITQHDINNLIGAIFREYPAKMLSSKGNYIFLDYLDTLTSERTAKYKSVLSDVKCSTKNRQYAQWILATRGFALVTIWCAIVNFYRNLLGRHGGKVLGLPVPSLSSDSRNVYQKRFTQALRHGFTDVMHYLNVNSYADMQVTDSHGRTLIFIAVMQNQAKALQYLVTRVKPAIDINQVSDTGNTALHAATNNGNAQLVSILLKNPDMNVNCVNPQCENASPLHLAVMHGHKDIVELLLKAGADKTLKMGDLTPADVARDFEHKEIQDILQ